MYQSLRTVVLELHTLQGVAIIPVEMDMMSANLPAFLRLNLMDPQSPMPCILRDSLVKQVLKNGKPTDWLSTKLTQAESAHLFDRLQLPKITSSTRFHLSKLYRQFLHRSSEKLFNLIETVSLERATLDTRKVLEDITKSFGSFQRI